MFNSPSWRFRTGTMVKIDCCFDLAWVLALFRRCAGPAEFKIIQAGLRWRVWTWS
jgi:hypothetical protein